MAELAVCRLVVDVGGAVLMVKDLWVCRQVMIFGGGSLLTRLVMVAGL